MSLVDLYERELALQQRERAVMTARDDIRAALYPCAHAMLTPGCRSCAAVAVSQIGEHARRTPEAQADIAAARAAPTDFETAMQDADAALSNAALADTPAVREMGGPTHNEVITKLHTMERASFLGKQGPELAAAPHPGLLTSLYSDEEAARVLREYRPGIVALTGTDADNHRAVWGTLPPGRVESLVAAIADPNPVILTGPEAERYRALQAAARHAAETGRAAAQATTALRETFLQFCSGVTKEG